MSFQGKTIKRAETFASSSGTTKYETRTYTDGTASCDCPGWTRRPQRTCKHTESLLSGNEAKMRSAGWVPQSQAAAPPVSLTPIPTEAAVRRRVVG